MTAIAAHAWELWIAFDPVVGFFIFFMYLLIDTLYAWYTLAVTQLKPRRAAFTAAAIYFLLAVGVLNYTANPLYIVPIVFGSWCGTYFSVLRESRKVMAAQPAVVDNTQT
ncbi:MAG TPA: hypothetical protein VJJ02_03855 [Candidatus Paceibacterota bacterium]